MSLPPREITNVYGGTRQGPRRRVREKVVAGVRLEIPEDPLKGGGGHGEGEGTWIFSFADLVMNLLMFFVMMFAISSVDKDKLAAVQSALFPLNKKAARETTEQRPAASTSGPQGLSLGAQSERPEAVLKRVKELLQRIDVSKLAARPALVREFGALKDRMVNLERLVGAQVAPDQDDDAFQIVFAGPRVFDAQGNVSTEGRRNLSKLARELARFGKPMRVSMLVATDEAPREAMPKERKGTDVGAGIGAQEAGVARDPWEESSLRASRAAAEIRHGGLPETFVLSSGGLGVAPASDAVANWRGGLVVHVGLLREKPFIHRGKDSFK